MSSTNREIKAIRVYQAVTFEGVTQTFFSSQLLPNRKPVDLSLDEKLQVVELKSEKDHILVPFTNIAGIYLAMEKDKVKKESKPKKVGIKSTEIKRPR